MVNKIYIDTSDYELKIQTDAPYFLIFKNKKHNLKIKIMENIKSKVFFIVEDIDIKLDIDLSQNSDLIINALGYNASISSYSNLLTNSKLRFVKSIITSNDIINNIKIYHQGANSKSIVLANGINLGNCKFYFIVDGIITKESRGTSLEEDSKIININNGDSKIIPNLIVDNEDVKANHAAFIGKFKDDDIWYLESRGLENKKIQTILFKAVLLKGIEEEVKEIFTNFLDEKINMK